MKINVRLFNNLDCLLDGSTVRVEDPNNISDIIKKAVYDLIDAQVLEVGDHVRITEAE